MTFDERFPPAMLAALAPDTIGPVQFYNPKIGVTRTTGPVSERLHTVLGTLIDLAVGYFNQDVSDDVRARLKTLRVAHARGFIATDNALAFLRDDIYDLFPFDVADDPD